MGTGKLEFTADDAKEAIRLREAVLQRATGVRRATARRATPAFTGGLAPDFPGAELLSYRKQADAAVRSAIAWDAQDLYVAWDVADNTPWTNGATDPAMLYLSGDTVDLQLAANPEAATNRNEAVAGDLRLSIGSFQGNPTAVLYRKTVAEGGPKKPRSFSSGVAKDYRMDYVEVLAKAVIKVSVQRGRGYVVEAAIPLADLGLVPKDGLTVRADFGVTHGDTAGQRTRLRTCWSNQHTGIVDDAVYELMMEPKYWGELLFQQ